MRENAHLLVLPRGLILLASVWLIVSWIISLGVRAPVHASSASYTPGVRTMLLCVTVGLMIAWPMLRLSQARPKYPITQTWLDLIVLLSLLQVVVWPLRLVTIWTPMRTAAIVAVLASWTVLAGAILATAVLSDRRGPRHLAMIACLALCLLGPGIVWVSGATTGELFHLSPLTYVYELGQIGTPPSIEQWRMVLIVAAASVMAWVAVAAIGIANRTMANRARK